MDVHEVWREYFGDRQDTRSLPSGSPMKGFVYYDYLSLEHKPLWDEHMDALDGMLTSTNPLMTAAYFVKDFWITLRLQRA